MSSTSLVDTPAHSGATRFAAPSVCLLILFALIDSQVVAAIVPQIADGLGTTPTWVASSVTVYSVFAATVAIGLARNRTVHHPQKWLPAAALGFAAASLLTGSAVHVAMFLAGRALAGFFGGLISALAIAALANASSYEKRGSQMSWVAISYFLAPVLGVPIGTFLTGVVGWRITFFLVAISITCAGVLVRLAKLTVTDTPSARDVDDGKSETGIAGASRRLFDLASRSRSTRMGIISAFFVSGGLVGFTTFLATWVHVGFGAGTREVSFIYALAGLGAVAGGAAGGVLADRLGKKRIALAASLGMAVFVFMVPGFVWGPWLFLIIGITAVFAALRVAPLQALVTEVVGPGERTTYVALRNASSQIGIAASVAMCSTAFARWGLFGVAFVCSILTLFGWITIRQMDDPHSRQDRRQTKRSMSLRLARGTISVGVAIAAIVFLLLPWLLSFLVTKASTRPDEKNRPETPATYGAVYEDVTFTSSDDLKLSGWYLPNAEKHVTIVVTHGLFRSRYETLERGVDFWKRGYSVLIYDLRRHGASQGEFCTLGYQERFDVEAATAFARSREPENRIVLFGVSMGAAATLLAASEESGIEAIIVDSSFLSLRHTVAHHLALARIPNFPFSSILVTLTTWRLGYAADDFDVLTAVRKIQCPILFIGSTGDIRMPVDTVLEPLFGAAVNPRKSKYIVPGATHGHAYAQDPAAYVDAITSFLRSSGV